MYELKHLAFPVIYLPSQPQKKFIRGYVEFSF